MKNIELVIFDCDGVLVDSEIISARIIAEVIRPLGINMTTEESYKKFVGGSMEKTLRFVRETLGREPEIDIENEYRTKSFAAYKKHMKPVDGIVEILKNISVHKCVGSNGPKSKIELNLDITGLNKYFDQEKIFSAYDIQKWKPEPDLYLHAAKSFNIEPKNCLVIEDSINGLKAANTAGMISFGINHPMKPLPTNIQGSTIFNHMDEIKNKMQEIGII